MIKLKNFVFGPFQENTYLLWNDSGEAAVVDPGMMNKEEEKLFLDFLKEKNITLKHVLLTHGHVDHVFGCGFLYDTFQLTPHLHPADAYWVEKLPDTCLMYGLPKTQFPGNFFPISTSEKLKILGTSFQILHVPGHSPGSVAFYDAERKFVISGDALFAGSIGRTDFPGGDYDTLIQSIKSKLFSLPDETLVYSGHGPKTTIGQEKKFNPFFN
ncbi:MAG: MBL fold metallo-hydrolase [Bacteroidia bacterium]|nr:MBL fold metallo-hydrolase [Bacteroidia bacterium]